MLNWLRRGKKKRSSNQPHSPIPQQQGQMAQLFALGSASVPLPPAEPDYDSLAELVLQPREPELSVAPTLFIGIGRFGEDVLQRLAATYEQYGVRDEKWAQFLSLHVVPSGNGDRWKRRQRSNDHQRGINTLRPDERLVLHVDRSQGDKFPWYESSGRGDELTRADGRLALYQDLRSAESALWSRIEKCIEGRESMNTWIVGSCTEPHSTGMVFELSHLIRLITGHLTRKGNFLGWMFAIPTSDWQSEISEGTVAFLREWDHLQATDLRQYSFNERSDNTALHKHDGPGKDDCDFLFLTQPADDLSREADSYLPELMGTGLLMLSDAAVGDEFKKRVNLKRRDIMGKAPIGAFNCRAEFIPTYELQQNVRSRVLYDLLFDKREGVFPSGAVQADEVDTESAYGLLSGIGRQSFKKITEIYQSGRYQRQGVVVDSADTSVFKRYLRQELQKIVDTHAPDALKHCDALLDGLENVFGIVESRLKPEALESLVEVVKEAKTEITGWGRWRSKARRHTTDLLREFKEQWMSRQRSYVWRSRLKNDAPDRLYKMLTENGRDIRREIRPYICWAWVVERETLRLTLDTLVPNWSAQSKVAWRHEHSVTQEAPERFWQGVQTVIQALTQDDMVWAAMYKGDFLDEFHVGDGFDFPLTLNCGWGENQEDWVYWMSGDQPWRTSMETGYHGAATSKAFESGPLSLGLGLHCIYPINITDITLFRSELPAYIQSYGEASQIHVFLFEQRALLLEKEALRRYHPRKEGAIWPLLPFNVVQSLKGWDHLQGFVGAWLSGAVEYDAQHLIWRLYSLPADDRATERMLLHSYNLDSAEPIDAWLVFDTRESSFSGADEWIQNGQALLEDYRIRSVDTKQYQEMEDWLEYLDKPKRQHWYILVEGLLSVHP